jgi:hypothetical protein
LVIGLLQRVTAAQVAVEGAVIAAIERGLLLLVGVEAGGGRAQADRLLERLLGYRVFPDGDGKTNLSLRHIGGGARRRAEEGPLWGSDPGDAHEPAFTFWLRAAPADRGSGEMG